MSIKERLEAAGITLPQAAAPAANYVPYTVAGNMLYISGQLPLADGQITVTGILGRDVDVETAQGAAGTCAINLLAQMNAALDGDLERVVQLVKIQGYVASDQTFTEQHLVLNGASDLLVKILGERGKHARAAVGMASLPLNAAVEIDAIVEIRS